MKKIFCFWTVMLLILTALPACAGIVIVNHDEWTLSEQGIRSADGAQFALNVGSLFADGQAGNFLVYSNNFGLTGSGLASTMTNAGHIWNITTSEDTSLANLLQFDGIFLCGGGSAMDNAVLSDYVRSGGNVYLAGGTDSTPGSTSGQWNGFLNDFGLEYADRVNGIRGTRATTSDHPLFDNVTSLYYNNGNSVSIVDPEDPNAVILEGRQPNGLIAIYNPVPVPAAVWLLGSGMGLLVTLRRKIG